MSPLATWTGPYTAMTPNGALNYGDERDVTDEDIKSAHWTPVETAKPAKTKPAEEAAE